MDVMVTGSLGYVGTVLVKNLIVAGIEVCGLDNGLYRDARLEDTPLDAVTTIEDIRDASGLNFKGVSTVVHLAALSNDPLGALNPSLTNEVNFRATVAIAAQAKAAGVSKFIFVSTQSIYGISSSESEALDEFSAEKKPITDYAKTKLMAEVALEKLHSSDFFCVILRPATVFGYSPRLRSDIVFNNLLAQAFFRGEIKLHSDGKPWRPVVHVQDLSAAILAAIKTPDAQMISRIYNVGVKDGNYRVLELAHAAQALVPTSIVTVSNESTPDERSYQVAFDRIYRELKFKPEWDLRRGGQELLNRWVELGCTVDQILGSTSVRLDYLKKRQQEGSLDEDLYALQ